MYAILGEARSDVAMLKVLVRRLAGDDSIPVKTKGFATCGELLRKGANQLQTFAALGCDKFIVCYDADGANALPRFDLVRTQIIGPARVAGVRCILVPVQEIEAWILADISAVSRVCTGFKAKAIPNPEAIASPKEYLEKLTRDSRRRPRYSHATHNEKVAKYLDLNQVQRACSSFMPLVRLVLQGVGNN